MPFAATPGGGPELAWPVVLTMPRSVLDQLIALKARLMPPSRAALPGGYDFARDAYFMRIGGEATVRSYWKDEATFVEASFEEVAERLPAIVPFEHIQFLGSGEDVVEIGDYIFVHAGIRPGVPIGKQSLGDLRWIREEFLDDERDHGAMIVHGHTIYDEVDEWPNRIGIDTGAYRSGVLTAIVLEGTERRYLKTDGE